MNIREAIIQAIKEQIPVQVFWAKVIKVGADTCEVERLQDELTFENVLFGLGENVFIPKQNSKVLCGIIQNQPSAFIIYAEEIDKIVLNAGEITLKADINLGDTNGEKAVKGETLNKLLNQILTYLQTLNAVLVTYGTAQAAELPAIAASNTAMATALSSQTANLSQMLGKLSLHLANKVKLK